MCASYKAALEAGHPVKIEVDQSMTLADGNCCFFLFFAFTQMKIVFQLQYSIFVTTIYEELLTTMFYDV